MLREPNNVFVLVYSGFTIRKEGMFHDGGEEMKKFAEEHGYEIRIWDTGDAFFAHQIHGCLRDEINHYVQMFHY